MLQLKFQPRAERLGAVFLTLEHVERGGRARLGTAAERERADVTSAQIDQEIISTGKIEFANAKNVVAVSITVDGTPYYAVFQVVAK